MKIAVIDGHGGGIGVAIVKGLREEFRESIEIIALGTNATATSAMLKARANKGATGENAIVTMAPKVSLILGSLSIISANSMLGELTPKMAEAIASSPAEKILIPMTQERLSVVGVVQEPLPHLVEEMIKLVRKRVMADV